MKKIIILIVVLSFSFLGFLMAQQASESKQNIFETLENSGSDNSGLVKVFQDKRIKQLVVASKTSNGSRDVVTASGFRVQVFSSNVQRTAKTEAFKLEKMIKEEFPDVGVYVNYSSPFWKVRVGDFKTQAQAQAFRSQLIETFPAMRSETYIVREQIIISGSKQ